MQNIVKTLMSGFKTLVNKKIRGSVADWNQNDSSADNYVKNRPFFTDEDMVVHKLDEKYLPDSVASVSDVAELQSVVENNFSEMQTSVNTLQNGKMDATNPVGTGSFSMNRKSGTEVGANSHSEGTNTTASGANSHAEGDETIASSSEDHAEGWRTTASGGASHAEGYGTVASGFISHAEGYATTASQGSSHAEGIGTTASGTASHAEGSGTTASGSFSHAGGEGTVASRRSSHIGGAYNIPEIRFECSKPTLHPYSTHTLHVSKNSSFYIAREYEIQNNVFVLKEPILLTTEELRVNLSQYIGYYAILDYVYGTGADVIHNIAENALSGKYIFVLPDIYWNSINQYKYRILREKSPDYFVRTLQVLTISDLSSSLGVYANIVGNGTADDARSNAHTLAWDGTAWYQGDVYVGSTSGTNKDEGSKKLSTEEYVNTVADTKQDKRTDEETIEMLIEADLLPAVSTPSGAVLTDQNGNVVLRY